MHARVRRDVAARPVLRGDCGGQQPQTCRGPGLATRHRQDPAAGLPGPAMPSAVTACAWRLLTGTGYTPGPPPGTDNVHGAPGPGHPPPARRRPPCHTDRAAASRSPPVTAGLTADGPHADAGEPAHQQHGGITAQASRPGTGSANARQAASALHARPPYGPGHHRHQRTARPGAGRDARPAQRRPSSHGRAARAARPWPSVESRRCTPTVLAAGRRPLTCIAAVTQVVPRWPHLRFPGVLHCAPLP